MYNPIIFYENEPEIIDSDTFIIKESGLKRIKNTNKNVGFIPIFKNLNKETLITDENYEISKKKIKKKFNRCIKKIKNYKILLISGKLIKNIILLESVSPNFYRYCFKKFELIKKSLLKICLRCESNFTSKCKNCFNFLCSTCKFDCLNCEKSYCKYCQKLSFKYDKNICDICVSTFYIKCLDCGDYTHYHSTFENNYCENCYNS